MIEAIHIILGLLICLISAAWTLFWGFCAEASAPDGDLNFAVVLSLGVACLGVGGVIGGLRLMGVF